jgi:hypothetical protein
MIEIPKFIYTDGSVAPFVGTLRTDWGTTDGIWKFSVYDSLGKYFSVALDVFSLETEPTLVIDGFPYFFAIDGICTLDAYVNPETGILVDQLVQ